MDRALIADRGLPEMNAIRLLIIDDDIAVLKSIEIAVRTRRPGWRADCLLDCADISSRLKDHNYDVILSDIRMPGINGIALLREVQTLSPVTPVVFLTGYSGQYATAAWQLGAFAVLDKPVDLKLLFETLEAAALCRCARGSMN
jgi:DNA-binding NtrC family response regulator